LAKFRIINLLLMAALIALMAMPAFGSDDSIMDRVKEANAPYDNLAIDPPLPSNIVRVKEEYQGGSFWVLSRKDAIGRYPCGKCHGKKESLKRDGAALAHGDIEMIHGKGEEAPVCLSCHDEKNRDLLADKKGREIDFDHSYQLCGQCHFRQKSDWVGGAHGKRETYWTGKRVVWNCATCHDPHAPRFKKRWPSTYSLPLEQ
jgi:hypothetical protein